MAEPLPADYLITPASTAGPDEAFAMDADYPPAASMLLDMGPEHPLAGCDLDDLCLYSMDPCAPAGLLAGDDRPPRPPAPYDKPERQLLELQQTLFAPPGAPAAADGVDGLQRTIDLTTRASSMLLSIIMALTPPPPPPPSTPSPPPPLPPPPAAPGGGGCGTTTMLLVTACYARILRNVDGVATRLHGLVRAGDHGALLSLLPCVQIGSLMPVAPAVQASVLVQLLSQSLREIEKRLPPLARAVLGPGPGPGPRPVVPPVARRRLRGHRRRRARRARGPRPRGPGRHSGAAEPQRQPGWPGLVSCRGLSRRDAAGPPPAAFCVSGDARKGRAGERERMRTGLDVGGKTDNRGNHCNNYTLRAACCRAPRAASTAGQPSLPHW